MSNPTDPYSRPHSEDEDNDILDPLPAQEEGSAKLENNEDFESTRTRFEEGEDLPAQARAAEREAWDEAFNAPVQPSAPSAPPASGDDSGHSDDIDRSDDVNRAGSERAGDTEPVSDDKYKSGTFAPVRSEGEFRREDSSPRESIFGNSRTSDEQTEIGVERGEFREDRSAERHQAPSIFDRDGRESMFDRERLSQADDATVVEAYEDTATRVSEAASGGDAELSSAPTTPQRTSVFDRTEAPSATSTPVAATSAATDQQIRRAVTPVPKEPSGRGWAHVGVFFATLLLAPFAWYLMSDAGIRLGVLPESQWETTTLDWMSLLEFLGALLCVGVLWYLAAQSAFAPTLFGFILFIGGMVALFAPGLAQNLLANDAVESFRNINAFTGNVVHHLTIDLATGRVAIFGFLLLMTGIVAHSARKSGEQRGNILGRRKVLLAKKDQ
ncbi:MAG: hypothetical protein Q4P33_08515 [Flaviflexus sp.]|nr:hypothetical protein [Flaviflexus sp.]